jgi:hypothetical protein
MNNGKLTSNETIPELATFSTWWRCGDFEFNPTDYPKKDIKFIEYCQSGVLLETTFFHFGSKIPPTSGRFCVFTTERARDHYAIEWGKLWQINNVDWERYNQWYEYSYLCPLCGASIRTEGWESSDPKIAPNVLDWGIRKKIRGTFISGSDEIKYEESENIGFDAYSSLKFGIGN